MADSVVAVRLCTAVRPGTVMPAAPAPFGFVIFNYLFIFSPRFRGTSGLLFGSTLGRKLGFSIAMINPFMGTLD